MNFLYGSGIGIIALGVFFALANAVTLNDGRDKTKWYAASACMMLVGIGILVVLVATKILGI